MRLQPPNQPVHTGTPLHFGASFSSVREPMPNFFPGRSPNSHISPSSNACRVEMPSTSFGTPMSYNPTGFIPSSSNGNVHTMNIGSNNFINRNLMFNLNDMSIKSLLRIQYLMKQELKSKTDPDYNEETGIATCVMCDHKSNDVGNVRKHESSKHFKCLVQYRATYGKYFDEILENVIESKRS
jgi:hypothetical protein